MKCGKRLSLCLLVLLLACCSLWAFPGRKARTPELETPVVQEVPEEVLPVDPVEEEVVEAPAVPEEVPALPEVEEEMLSEKDSTETSEAISTELRNLSENLNEKSRVSGKTLDDLKATLSLISAGVDAVTADRDELLALYQEQLDQNAKQADDLAYLRGAYDKESGAKAFAKVGAVIGFEELMPTWGLSCSLGARFGKGFLIEAGAQYMLGTFQPGNLLYDEASLDNLAITTSIGWEW